MVGYWVCGVLFVYVYGCLLGEMWWLVQNARMVWAALTWVPTYYHLSWLEFLPYNTRVDGLQPVNCLTGPLLYMRGQENVKYN
jgi:hypothetical protein